MYILPTVKYMKQMKLKYVLKVLIRWNIKSDGGKFYE